MNNWISIYWVLEAGLINIIMIFSMLLQQAEIDARESNFNECISLGKELLTRNHYASNEIKEKLVELTEQRNGMLHKWEERWEHLQLILEVYQFARDAAVAEAWLIAQDPYLKSEDLGVKMKSIFSIVWYIKQIYPMLTGYVSNPVEFNV